MSADRSAMGGHAKPFGYHFFRFWGFVCLVLWLAAVLDEIQTSEAWLGAPIGNTLVPNWLIIIQPFQLVLGLLPAIWVAPVFLGWGVEALVMIFTFGLEHAQASAKKYNAKLAGWFLFVCGAAFIFDMYSNWSSHLIAGTMTQQLAFIVILAAIAAFLPYGMLSCFKHAQDFA